MSTPDDDRLERGLAAAIAAVGSKAELARRINKISREPLTSPAISQWRCVPLDRVSDVFLATAIPKHILRPDQHDPQVVVVQQCSQPTA